jgi:uncharacterized protein involved in exopolysaccharide biosynthesis
MSQDAGSEKKENPSLAEGDFKLRSEIEQLAAQIEEQKKERALLRKSLVSYQAKPGTTSGLERTQNQLYNNYEDTRRKLGELLVRNPDSEKSDNSNLTRVAIRFQVLMPPSLPTWPVSPIRPLLMLVGVALGLLAATVFVAMTGRKEKHLFSLEDISKMTGLPILARIPIINIKPKAGEYVNGAGQNG